MIDTKYWYYGNIRHMILCVLRLFQNFCVSSGVDEDGNQILKRVPVTFMSTDKSVVYMLNNNTDTVLQTVPKMVLALSNVKLNNDKISGAPYYPDATSFTEKKFNPDLGNYEYKPGNSYNITRLNPLPIGLEFKLFVLTTMMDQKLQLFEQIRSLFSPTLEIQTSENPIDWSRVTSIALTGLNWSSKGTTNLDSTTLDSMDMTFEIDMNIDMPTIVEKQTMIEQINERIGDGNSIDDIMGWDLSDTTILYHNPTKNAVQIFLNEESGKEKIRLIPSEIAKTWYDVFRIYGFDYNPLNKDYSSKIKLTAIYDDNNNIIEWYFDIARKIGKDNGVPYEDDLYLDVVVTPSGDVILLDEDELKEAFDKKEMTKEEYDEAYKIADDLMERLKNNKDKLQEYTGGYLNQFLKEYKKD